MWCHRTECHEAWQSTAMQHNAMPVVHSTQCNAMSAHTPSKIKHGCKSRYVCLRCADVCACVCGFCVCVRVHLWAFLAFLRTQRSMHSCFGVCVCAQHLNRCNFCQLTQLILAGGQCTTDRHCPTKTLSARGDMESDQLHVPANRFNYFTGNGKRQTAKLDSISTRLSQSEIIFGIMSNFIYTVFLPTWQRAKPRTLTGQLFIDFGDFVDLLLFAILCMWNFMVKFLFMISIIGTSSSRLNTATWRSTLHHSSC